LKKKTPGDLGKDIVRIAGFDNDFKVVWEDGENIGLRSDEFIDFSGFSLKKPLEDVSVNPVQVITEKELLNFESSDKTRTVVNLMSELSDPNTNVDRFKVFIRELPELEQEIIDKANSVEKAGKVIIKDVDLAVVRLGFETVKDIAGNFVKRKVSMANPQLSEFKHYEAYNILKGVLFKRLSPIFGFRDLRSEGSSLLATETVGATILIENAKDDLKKFYTGPKAFYSSATRLLERVYFGKDLVEVNDIYFKEILGMFEFLFGGYILAHQTIDLTYDLPSNIKLTLSSRKLKFAFISYLVFLGLKYIFDRDRESGYAFISRLKRAGMDVGKAMDFVNNCIFEANDILSSIGLRRSLRPVSVPSYPFKIERFFPESIHFGYLVLSFRNFSLKDLRRLILRSEDEFFTMYVLNKFLDISSFNLNDKSFIVLPCENLEDEEIDADQFSMFDILIFKGIDRLNPELKKEFLKLWKEFDGIIIGTLDSLEKIDLKDEDMFKAIRNYIVDFPSYFLDEKVYESMLDHCDRFQRDNLLNLFKILLLQW